MTDPIQKLRVKRFTLVKLSDVSDIVAADSGEVNMAAVGNQIYMKDSSGNVLSPAINVAKAFSATTGAVELDLTTGDAFTVTPTGAVTLTAINLTNFAGKEIKIIITSTGTTSRTISFSTGFTGVNDFKTGTIASVVRILRFYCDGSTLREIGNRQPLGTTALTPGSSVAIEPSQGDLFTLTPGEDETITAATVHAGYSFKLKVLTSGTTSRTLTFTTGFKITGTLATGTTDAKIFILSFTSDGTQYCETGRTAAM